MIRSSENKKNKTSWTRLLRGQHLLLANSTYSCYIVKSILNEERLLRFSCLPFCLKSCHNRKTKAPTPISYRTFLEAVAIFVMHSFLCYTFIASKFSLAFIGDSHLVFIFLKCINHNPHKWQFWLTWTAHQTIDKNKN